MKNIFLIQYAMLALLTAVILLESREIPRNVIQDIVEGIGMSFSIPLPPHELVKVAREHCTVHSAH